MRKNETGGVREEMGITDSEIDHVTPYMREEKEHL
jgi:hypothetical protein